MPSLLRSSVLLAAFFAPSDAEFALWRRRKFGTSVPQNTDGSNEASKKLKSVIHIVVSGMRPESNEAYGRKYMVTPTLDRLAMDSMTFQRAYSQLPSWSASRYSFMHGVRPDSDRLWTIHENGDQTAPINLPDFFKSKGYNVANANESTYEEHVNSMKEEECSGIHKLLGSRACLVDNMEEVYEYHVANDIIAKLQQAKKSEDPFYFFMNLRQPGTSRNLHRSFWDLYPEESKMPRALHRNKVTYQGEEWDNGQAIPGQTFFPDAPMQKNEHDKELGERRARKAYYVSITQADAQIGRVLRALEAFGLADKTIVVVHGDHGSQLGEHGIWEPALLEPSLRVPLWISAPWKTKSIGKSTSEFAELVDLRRTVPMLAGLEESGAHSDGHDLSVLFDVPTAETKPVAISQILGCLTNGHAGKFEVLHVSGPSAAWRDCWHPVKGVGQGDPPVLTMGYSVRVDGYRYIEWRNMDPALLVPDWTDKPLRTELYQINEDSLNDFDSGIGGHDLTKNDETHKEPESISDIMERLHELLEEYVPVEDQAHALDEFRKLPSHLRKPRPWDELLGTFFSGETDDVTRINAGHEL